MVAPAFRAVGGIRQVPSYRVIAWTGWRNGPLDHSAAHRLRAVIGIARCPHPDVLVEEIHNFARQHRALGASYYDVDGRPWLDMTAAKLPMVDQFDASIGVPGDLEQRVRRVVDEYTRGSFDLGGPLFRVALIRTGESRYRLLALTHHLISDAVTVSLLANLLRNRLAPHTAEKSREVMDGLDYGDYLFCMNEWFESDASRQSRAYWKSLLPASPDEFVRPMGGIAEQEQAARYADRVEFTIGGPILRKIDALARALCTTRFTVLLAAQQAVIASLNDAESALIVAVTDGREHASLRGTLGYMADKVIYCSHVSRAATFGGLVTSTHQQTALSYPHRYFRYDRLLNEFWPDSAAKFAPPMFNFIPHAGGGSSARDARLAAHPGLVVTKVPPSALETHPARANFSLKLTDRGEVLVGNLAFTRAGCEIVMRMLNEIFVRVSPDGNERVSALTSRS